MKMRGNFLAALILALASSSNLSANLWTWIICDDEESFEVLCDEAVVAKFEKQQSFPPSLQLEHPEDNAPFSYVPKSIHDEAKFRIEYPKKRNWCNLVIDCRGGKIFSLTFSSAVPGQGQRMVFYEIESPLFLSGQNCSIPVMIAVQAITTLLSHKDS